MGRKVLLLFIAGGLAGGLLAGVFVALAARGLFFLGGSHLNLIAILTSIAAFAYFTRQAGIIGFPAPTAHHQVPEAWRNIFSPGTGSFLYAGALGLTFFTRVSSYSLYPLVLLLLGLGRWPIAIMSLFAITGLARASTTLLVPTKGWSKQDAIDISGHIGAAAVVATRLGEFLLLGISAALMSWGSLSIVR